MYLGLSSYSYPWAIGVKDKIPSSPMTVWELLDRTRKFGFSRLQLADNLPVHQLFFEEWKHFILKTAEAGVQLELGARGLRQEHVQKYIELAIGCRSPFLRFVIDDKDFEPEPKIIKEIIKAVLPDLKQANLLLAIENHDRFPAKELADIIESTDPDRVGICLDTANSLGAGEGIVEVIQTLAPYTVNVHVKDFRILRYDHQMGFTVTGCPTGQGQVPLQWLFEQLEKTGKCQSATLEVWSTPLESMEATLEREEQWVEESVKALKDLKSAIDTEF